MLEERAPQLRAVQAAASGAVSRRGRSVLVTGPRGSGASALLDEAARAAQEARRWLVLRARAAPDESDLDHALLQQLLLPLLDELDRLGEHGTAIDPAPRLAMEVAAGWHAPGTVQVPLSMAVLLALEAVGRHHPVLVLVDDAQWADEPSAAVLRFLCRRLARTPVAVVLAAADAEPGRDWADVDTVVELTPLSRAAAEALLDARAPDLDPAARERVLDHSLGRPRRLVDLGDLGQVAVRAEAGLRARGAALPVVRDALERLEECSPAERRRLVLLGLLEEPAAAAHAAAAEALFDAEGEEPSGVATPLPDRERRDRFGPRGALDELHADPLLARVAAEAASAPERQRARRAWAGALRGAATGGRDSTAARLLAEAHRHAALLLLAGPGPSSAEQRAAAEDLRATSRALLRHDPRRAGDLLALAADLEGDSARRGADLLLAAERAWAAGRPRLAEALTRQAGRPASALARGVAERTLALRALAAGDQDRGTALLARSLEVLVAGAGAPAGVGSSAQDAACCAQESLATAAGLAVVAPRCPGGTAVEGLRAAADSLPQPQARRVALIAPLLSPWAATRPEEQEEALVEVLEVVEETGLPLLRWAADAARLLGRCPLVHTVGRSRAPRLTGPEAVDLHLARCAGSLQTSADRAAEHLDAARKALRHAPDLSAAVVQAGLVVDLVRGQLVDDPASELPPHAPRTTETDAAVWVVAHRHRLRGEMTAAASVLRRLWPTDGSPPRAGALLSALPLAQSLHESGVEDELRSLLEHVEAWSAGSGAALARTCALLIRAQLELDPLAEQVLLEAASGATGPALAAGTADLALGMHLRRARRGVAARGPLQRAVDAFDGAGMVAFADLARRELAATAPQRPPRRMGSSDLTSQERVVADLAAGGASNAEIALSLGISSRTVAHHLQHVYAKLGISGRRQLAVRLQSVTS